MNAQSLPGFNSPSASTEAPLEMLLACHGRVEKQCQTLQRLWPHVQAHGCDEQARQAAVAVMRYFDTAARHHHADEEENLFPTLLQRAPAADLAKVQALVTGLLAEHRHMEGLWQVLRAQLDAVATGGPAQGLEAGTMEAFVSAYERHIDTEDHQLLPMANRLLEDADIALMGRAMRERRGIGQVD